jgi:glycolate oxidase
MLELLEVEIAIALALLGATRLGELGRSHVCAAPPPGAPHVHSAFPLLSTTPEIPR